MDDPVIANLACWACLAVSYKNALGEQRLIDECESLAS